MRRRAAASLVATVRGYDDEARGVAVDGRDRERRRRLGADGDATGTGAPPAARRAATARVAEKDGLVRSFAGAGRGAVRRSARAPRSPWRSPPRSGGCGLGAGEEQEGGAELRVTRDFGHEELGSARSTRVREDQTVMRLLRSEFDVETRFGGRFVQSIDGLEGRGRGRHGATGSSS